MEQKMKRLSEELNCQRQNAESARQSLEQKLKAKEKEYQEVRQEELFQLLIVEEMKSHGLCLCFFVTTFQLTAITLPERCRIICYCLLGISLFERFG